MTNWRRRTRSTAPAGHDVHSADLDWNLTMAQPGTATGLGMWYVPPDSRATQKQATTWKLAGLSAAVDTEACNLNLPWYLPPSAGFNLKWWLRSCHQVAAFKMQVTLSRAVPVPVPRAGAYWRPSQCSRSVWAGFSIKTFGHKKQKKTKIEEVAPVDLHAHERATCNHWKGRTYFTVQCFWLLFSFWLSISRIFLQIHKSVGHSNLSHQRIANSITSTTRQEHVSLLHIHCCMISSFLLSWFNF